MIVEPTVKELLKHAENRYALVIAVSRRAREIEKKEEGKQNKEEKSTVTVAANEFAEGKVYIVDENGIENKENEELKNE